MNQLGDYNKCLNLQNSSYFLVNLYSPLLPPELSTYIGLCFSESCSAEQVQNFFPNTMQALNISADGLAFWVRKSNGNEGDVSIDHSSYIIVVVLCLIVALGFMHPLLSLLKKDNKPKPKKGVDLEENISVATKEGTITTQLLPDAPKKPSRLMEFFKCFAVDQNLKRVFSVRKGPLDLFNGVRALSLLYVILGHDFYLRAGMSQNPAYMLDFIRTPFFLIIASAFYAVDVFFWLSGFFLAFVLLDPQTKK